MNEWSALSRLRAKGNVESIAGRTATFAVSHVRRFALSESFRLDSNDSA